MYEALSSETTIPITFDLWFVFGDAELAVLSQFCRWLLMSAVSFRVCVVLGIEVTPLSLLKDVAFWHVIVSIGLFL